MRYQLACCAGLLLGLLAAGCGGKPTIYRLYDGPPRPTGEVAVLTDTEWVQVFEIDGEQVGSDPYGWPRPSADTDIDKFPVDTFHLPPGHHTITARVWKVKEGYQSVSLTSGVNLWTLEHDFVAGRRYSFIIDAKGPEKLGGTPALAEMKADGAPLLVARPLAEPRVAAPPNPGEGAVIRGQALMGAYTATGLEIRLLPDTNAIRLQLRRLAARLDGSGALPQAIKSTRGYGLGFFEFRDVAPGEYLIAWRTSGGFVAAAPLKLTERDRIVDRVLVSDNPAEWPLDSKAEPQKQRV